MHAPLLVSLQPAEYCPGHDTQLALVHLAAPGLLMKPEGQDAQLAEPATADVLAEHCVQLALDVAPTTALAVPAEQFLQVPALVPPQLSRYVPAAQLDVQAVQFIALAALYMLLGQAVHEPADAPPQPSRYEPALQLDVHCVQLRAFAAL